MPTDPRKYWRLLKSMARGIRRTYIVWQMQEVRRSGKELYSCATCGMARSEPCEHWLNMKEELSDAN